MSKRFFSAARFSRIFQFNISETFLKHFFKGLGVLLCRKMQKERTFEVDKKIFSYSYSAEENEEARSIREKYLPKEESKLDAVRRLDAKIQSAGLIESLAVGIIGVLVFGLGMCMGLGAVAGGMTFGVILGVTGALIMLSAYPMYRICFRAAKEKYVPEILRLTEEIGTES